MAEQHSSGEVTVKAASGTGSYFASIVILFSLITGTLLYIFVMGDSGNFVDGNPDGHPVDSGAGKWFGLMYKGGQIVPIAVALLLMLIVFSIERFITLNKASGKGSMDVFVKKIQMHLESDNIQAAMDECDVQQGAIGNVVKEVLKKYREMNSNTKLDKEARMAAIQKSLEEAVALELPMLEKHLVIIATIVSIATLVGLIGTVLGMIRAFSALATAGAPDPVGLATGISEALVNTGLGITTSTIATVLYNYFTSNIDEMTYRIDEAGFSIVQTFAAKHSH